MDTVTLGKLCKPGLLFLERVAEIKLWYALSTKTSYKVVPKIERNSS